MRPRGLRTRSAIAEMPSQTVLSSAFSASVRVSPARASRYSNVPSLMGIGIRPPSCVAVTRPVLLYPPVPRDAAEAEPDIRQVHDPQPRLAVVEHELGF